jgi:adenine/guanine phosphoribosyltransferase-like PRPP-binding protein
MNKSPYMAKLTNFPADRVPAPPYTDRYWVPLCDGTQLELPIEPLPGGEQAIVLLMSNQTPFIVEDKLASLLAVAVAELEPEVIIGVPTMGLDYARLIAARLGHEHYAAFGTSRKFWYDEELSVPVNSVTSPGVMKRLYLDPALLDRVAGKRAVIIDDVIATGSTIRSAVELALKTGAEIAGLGFVFSEEDPWKDVLREFSVDLPGKVRVIGEIPRLYQVPGGWAPQPVGALT